MRAYAEQRATRIAAAEQYEIESIYKAKEKQQNRVHFGS